ncbi:MAG: hypothetical protein HOD63_08970 [Bacteroidetes bacterium]|jgi:hypothetical protein|nr:hypothetical protein [Bacteroidota bacterium]
MKGKNNVIIIGSILLLLGCSSRVVSLPIESQQTEVKVMAQQYAEIAVSSSKNYDLSDRQSDLLVSEHIITTLEKNGTIKTLEQRKWFMNFYLVYLSGSSGGVQYFV